MHKIRSLLPLGLTIAGTFGITALALYRLLQEPSLIGKVIGGTAMIVYSIWKFIESKITRKEMQNKEENYDKGTLELVAVVETLLLISLFIDTSYVKMELALAGLILMIFSILFRLRAIQVLGDNYTLRIRRIKGYPIIRGPYKIIRHPAYLGTILAHTGVVMILPNIFSLTMLLLWYISVIIRASVEDSFLRTIPKYKDYAEKVHWRLFPGIF